MDMAPASRRKTMNKLRELFDDPTENELSLMKNEFVLDISGYNLISTLEYKPVIYDTVHCAPYHHDIVYIHKTNCPNCGGLLDGDEHNPYVHCGCCGAKVWSEREVS